MNKDQCVSAINVAMMLEKVGYNGAEFDYIFGQFANNDPQKTTEVLELYRETSDCTRKVYLEVLYQLPSCTDKQAISYKL